MMALFWSLRMSTAAYALTPPTSRSLRLSPESYGQFCGRGGRCHWDLRLPTEAGVLNTSAMKRAIALPRPPADIRPDRAPDHLQAPSSRLKNWKPHGAT